VPHKFEFQGIISYGYEDEVLLFSEMTFPPDMAPGTYTIGLEANWLVCEVSCIPGSVALENAEVIVTDGGPSEPSPFAPLFDHAASFHPGGLPPGVEISGKVDPPVLGFEQPFTVTLDVKHPADVTTDDTGWPFFVPIAGDQWMILETAFEKTEGGTRITMKGETFAPEEVPVNDQVGGLFQIQTADGWARHEFSVPLNWTKPVAAASADDGAPSGGEAVVEPVADVGTGDQDTSFASMLLLAFFGGMLLNIMPCVLPVLSLKIYSLIEQQDTDVRGRQKAGIGYTIGVLASFLALGGTVIIMRSVLGLEVGWGYQFQAPEYVIALATLVFVFGLSLFGVFEVPAFGASSMSAAQAKEGMAGHILTGAFATLLATPCSAPFLGTGMGFAFTLPNWGILLFFGVAGFGLAMPFLLIAYVPAMARFLPKPGAWMETFKQFMGFTLMATTVWLIDVLAAQTGVAGASGYLGFLLVVSFGCWVVGRWGGPVATDGAKLRSLLIAVGLSVFAGMQFLVTDFSEPEQVDNGEIATDLDFSEEVPWQPFTEDRVKALAGQPVFVDFTADWCLSCKVNEKTVLASESVRSAMKANGVVPLKADWTRRDAVITKWLQRYGKAGVPFYLMIPADTTRAHIPLPEIITPGIVIDAFERAK
jgi:thiol:disulfide interchange protein DsbD